MDISLNVVIVGAGLAGLAAAQALKLSGHNVKIIEKSLQKGEIGAGINVTANATKILDSWGFDFVRTRALDCCGYQLFDANNMRLIESADVRNTFNAKFHFLFRPDYHGELKRLATTPTSTGSAAALYTGVAVAGVDPAQGIVRLTDGTMHRADLIIGADGVHSITRQFVVGDAGPESTGFNAFRFTVPTEKMLQLPNLLNIYSQKKGWWSVFTSGKQGLIWYECKGGGLQNFVAFYESTEDVASQNLTQAELMLRLLDALAKFHPDLVSLLHLAEDIKPWKLLYQPPLPKWSAGSLLLVGDAAHPVHSVQSGQGSNLAIEDAGVLQLVFKNVKTKTDIPILLEKFEQVRCRRAAAVQTLSRIPRGRESNDRDLLKQLLPTHVEIIDGASRDAYIYGYDAVAESSLAIAG